VGGDYWRLPRPRLGYDAPNDAHLHTETWHGSIPVAYVHLPVPSTILKAPRSACWWQQNGMSPGLEFTPRRGSYSSRTLEEVLRQAGYEGIEA
jgi:hypothetical protein